MNRRPILGLTVTILLAQTLATPAAALLAANSHPKPNDAFVDVHNFVFGDGETLASLKLHYGYKDQVQAEHQMLERIGVKHLRVVLGTSMGGMQTWLWGEMFPNDMDCLVALASTPAAVSGRNMIWPILPSS